MTTVNSTTVNPFRNRTSTFTLTILILLIVGSVDVYSINEFSFLESDDDPDIFLQIVAGVAIGLSVWFLLYSLNRPPYRIKTEEELSGLPFDNPPVDYGGYRISNPESMYAARNLPPTNDPDEIQGRKWQMNHEQVHGSAPTSWNGVFSVFYWRNLGRDPVKWDMNIEKDGDKRFGIGEFTLMVLMALVVGLLIFASCSSDS